MLINMVVFWIAIKIECCVPQLLYGWWLLSMGLTVAGVETSVLAEMSSAGTSQFLSGFGEI